MHKFCRNACKRVNLCNTLSLTRFSIQPSIQSITQRHAASQAQSIDAPIDKTFIDQLSSISIPNGYQVIVCKDDSSNDDNSNNSDNNNTTGDDNNTTTSDDGSNSNSPDSSTPTEPESDPYDPVDDSSYSMTPSQMMKELDRFVIGQSDAKKAVAVAWRARWRRQRLPKNYQPEVTPKNILMVGPTGCGKTEVARRLARLSDSPFVKVEATKFTEVGYVGKDVNTIIEDLVQHAATLVKQRKKKQLEKELSKSVNDIILKSLVGKATEKDSNYWRKKIEDGTLDETNVDIDIQKEPDLPSFLRGGGGGSVGRHPYLIFSSGAGGSGDGGKTEKKQYPIRRAREILMEQELKKYLSENDLANQALELAENEGIVFIDEIDKICGSRDSFRSERRVSQEGVQRDLLPLIEGCSVMVQNYGKLNTDHILFICAGAFHDSKPSDLMPEFQGRLPVRVELKGLTEEDMHRILSQTEYNLISQQLEMIKTEDCTLKFTDEAIRKIARVAVQCNENVENIGARRLVTVIEKIMEEINIDASEASKKDYVIDEEYVNKNLGDIAKAEDLTNFIL